MSARLIVEQAEFEEFCGQLRGSGLVAFDTEFISEDTYSPELCLLQFATADAIAAVDPYYVADLTSWWDLMADDETTVVVHGGQAEIRFCHTFAGHGPRRIADIQIAEGLYGRSYPLGYSAIVARVLGRRVHGKETRTDWRHRPLSEEQVQYALEDVQHILAVWERQRQSLERLKRLEWAEAEFRRALDEITEDLATESWRRLPGIHRLGRREIAVARELAIWREQDAERLNRPIRRVLRDDLVIELAVRQPRSPRQLLATRDMNRTHQKRAVPAILQAIERGLAVPESELPAAGELRAWSDNQEENALIKLLAIALADRCAEMNVARPLVATNVDLKHLVRWHVFGERQGPPPRLATGWRAQVCGDLLTDVLDGKVTLRVADPESEHPLVFERREPGGAGRRVQPH